MLKVSDEGAIVLQAACEHHVTTILTKANNMLIQQFNEFDEKMTAKSEEMVDDDVDADIATEIEKLSNEFKYYLTSELVLAASK